jgi:transcriptional regulator with XRE-family HTH domain
VQAGFNLALGGRLRAARRHRGLSLTEVEEMSRHEFKASVLGAYERGERSLSVQRLVRLAALYEMPVKYLLPTDADVDTHETPNEVDLDSISDTEESAIVDRFLSSIHLMRRPEAGEMAVRRSDMAILSSMLESLPIGTSKRAE